MAASVVPKVHEATGYQTMSAYSAKLRARLLEYATPDSGSMTPTGRMTKGAPMMKQKLFLAVLFLAICFAAWYIGSACGQGLNSQCLYGTCKGASFWIGGPVNDWCDTTNTDSAYVCQAGTGGCALPIPPLGTLTCTGRLRTSGVTCSATMGMCK